MLKKAQIAGLLVTMLAGGGLAAPLFPDVSERHWAAEAVRSLAARGLVEGYGDGTFKGDRAASRYELAMVVARLLARMEQDHTRLATRDELATIRKLAENLRQELAALGVQVTNVEGKTELLDQRVKELERITFSGRMVTRLINQSFYNRGNTESGSANSNRRLNYNSAVGSLAGSNFLPTQRLMVPPVMDMSSGRPLTNGTGFATTLYLNVGVQHDEDWHSELGLAGYSSQGNSVIDSAWGPTPPWLTNSFTGRNPAVPAGDGLQPLTHAPFTRMVLDHLRVNHGPSGVEVTLGAFDTKFMSPQVFMGVANPTIGNPRILNNFGFHVSGDQDPWGWEAFYAMMPDGPTGINAPQYGTGCLGAALTWSGGGWVVGAGLTQVANSYPPGGSPTTVGQTTNINVPQNGAIGEYYTEWVNPPEFFVNQLGGPGHQNVAGAGSLSDIRPIPGFGNTDALHDESSFGPQSQLTAGVNLEWADEDRNLRVFGDYVFSDYKPNRNSTYGVSGKLWRIGVEKKLLDEALELSLEYRHTDSTFDPMTFLYSGAAAGVDVFRVYYRVPDFNDFWHQYHLHNTKDFPHNRRGFWSSARWRYQPDGFVKLSYRHLEQVKTSLQDVRFRANSVGPGLPNVDVLGFNPGHFDVVFRGLSPLSFDNNFQPLEDPRGTARSWKLELSNAFTGTPWRVDAGIEDWHFVRSSSLSASQGGSQNHVDFHSTTGRVAVGYQVSENVLVTGGYEFNRWKGRWDPRGNYNPQAIARNDTTFTQWDSQQHVPFLNVNWEVTPKMRVETGLRLFNTTDQVPVTTFANPPGAANVNIANSNHPFSWSGYQLVTTVDYSF